MLYLTALVAAIVFAVLLALKLTGVTISWWIVFSPVIALTILLVFLGAIIITAFSLYRG